MLTYVFKEGKYKGKAISELTKTRVGFRYLTDIATGKEKINIPKKTLLLIKDIIKKGKMRNKAASPDENKRVKEVVEWYKQGAKKSEVELKLLSEGLSSNYVGGIIANANKHIIETFKEEKQYLIGLHLSRYDALYEKHIGLAAAKIGPKFRWKRVDHYLLAMEALLSKEKLLGLHSRKYNIQLNNYMSQDTSRRGQDNSYNFEKLSIEELVELDTLIKKSKVLKQDEDFNEDDILNQSMNQVKKIIEEVDEVIDEIEENDKSPLELVKHEDKHLAEIIHRKKNQGSNLSDVQKKIQDSNTSVFQQMLIEKMKKR